MKTRVAISALICLTAFAWVATTGAAEVDAGWLEELEKSRADREERLRDPNGWLTLAGLFWLEQGPNEFGRDEANTVVLAAEGVPVVAGQLVLEGETTTLNAAITAGVTLDGESVSQRVLNDDQSEDGPDVLTLSRLRFYVIRRGDRFGVRVKDPEHPALKAFTGLDYYAADPAYRLDATFVPYDEPREVEVMSVVGTTSTMLVPGEVRFRLGGRDLSLLPLVSEPGETELWFIFKDTTSGKETYGFRYLYGDLVGDRVDLDFNRAYNPPCAFTPFATCPLPMRENRLDVAIEAGERIYGKH